MRVGITGGAGFIGGHIIQELVARGHQVIVFDHLGRLDRRVFQGMSWLEEEAVT